MSCRILGRLTEKFFVPPCGTPPIATLDNRRVMANVHVMCWHSITPVACTRRYFIPHLPVGFAVILISLAALIIQSHARAATEDFFQRFVANIETNRIASWMPVTDTSLIDRSNTNAKLAGLSVKLDDLMSRGQLGPIQLGTTMEDTVAHWGKPRLAYGYCYGGHRLVYSDCNLIFRSNSLSRIMLDPGTVFDRASTKSNLHSWTNLLGVPSYVFSNHSRFQVTYETRGAKHTALLLHFDKDGKAISSPTIFLDPIFTNSLPQ